MPFNWALVEAKKQIQIPVALCRLTWSRKYSAG